MNLRKIEEWMAHCQQAISGGRNDPLAGGAWTESMSTPPPSLNDPLERIPLERARELRDAANKAGEAPERSRLLSQALEWLANPYPGTAPAIDRLIARERRAIQAALEPDL